MFAIMCRAQAGTLAATVSALFSGAAAASAADLSDIPLPSGQTVTFADTIRDAPGPDGLTVRFRFVAPAIARSGGSVDADTAQDDMQVLCDSFALPRILGAGPVPSQIIISLSDRPVKFAEPDEAATQYFEAYSIEDGACIWNEF